MSADDLAADAEIAFKALRAPFPDAQVGKLPRVTCRDCRDAPSRACNRHPKLECPECGNYMTGAHMHLDYVGHAAVTDRLLAVDPAWSWEPVAFADDGGPMIRVRGSMATLWIRLTVLGVSRLGVGSAQAGKDDVEKELIGDALRNAAMRFGVALDLWSKEDLHTAEDDAAPRSRPTPTQRDQGPMADPDGQSTQAGNTRRGPQILEGWSTGDEQVAAHAAFSAAVAALTEERRAELNAWRSEQGYSAWPMPKAEHDAIEAWLFGDESKCPTCGVALTDENRGETDPAYCKTDQPF